jgi:hypothetical protein
VELEAAACLGDIVLFEYLAFPPSSFAGDSTLFSVY